MRVLFIGNSHTYFNDMPFLFQCFTQSEKARKGGVSPAFSTMIAHGGRHLSEHINEPEVRYNIRCGGYDFVVLQEAAHPFLGKETLLRDGGKLSEWIAEADSKMVGYMTWAKKSEPWNFQEMIDSYTALCEENNGSLAPVGAIWEKILKGEKGSDIELYYTDGAHASLAGSYLAACVLYAAMTRKSPLGLPERFSRKGQTAFELPIETAEYLQKMASGIL